MKTARARGRVWLLALSLFSAAAGATESVLWWRAPAAPDVAWRGMLATEGGAVGMGTQIGLYPVIGVAGLLAAIVTHAAIAQGSQSAQRRQEQEAADKVLEPYGTLLRDWPASALWAAAMAQAAVAEPGLPPLRLLAAGAAAAEGAVVEAAPLYTLAQDEGVLVLDLAVKLVPSPGAAAQESLVRVVSSPHGAADARAHWSADGARALKAAAAAMLAHGLRLAVRHPPGPAATAADDVPMRTHRYLQGTVERSERAQQVAAGCARVVLRTLRGGLLSVPQRPAEGSTCGADNGPPAF